MQNIAQKIDILLPWIKHIICLNHLTNPFVEIVSQPLVPLVPLFKQLDHIGKNWGVSHMFAASMICSDTMFPFSIEAEAA